MTEQLALVQVDAPPGPKLTERQQFTLRFVEDTGTDGCTSDEVGAAWCAQRGKHHVHDRCEYDGRNGNQVLRSLQAKGLVKYRRRTANREGAWIALSAPAISQTVAPAGMLGDDQEIPF